MKKKIYEIITSIIMCFLTQPSLMLKLPKNDISLYANMHIIMQLGISLLP